MNLARFHEITGRFRDLRIAVVGDVCLDRYLEIDPAREELSIETGLPVHNVIGVRAQPGGAGTILNNLAMLGIGDIHVVGACGDDGEGFELRRALAALPGVNLGHFITATGRRTFTYCKPIVCRTSQPPQELSRLDSKNWSPTPLALEDRFITALHDLAGKVNAMILLDQVHLAGSGVFTRCVLAAVNALASARPELFVIADSRRSLRGFPPVSFKMNGAELAALTSNRAPMSLEEVRLEAGRLAQRNQRPVFITLSEHGLLGATPDGIVKHLPVLPVRGAIDVVGAGDAVTANLTASTVAGASLGEALSIANAAASVVIHQLGTTGTANLAQLAALLTTG